MNLTLKVFISPDKLSHSEVHSSRELNSLIAVVMFAMRQLWTKYNAQKSIFS